MSKFEKVYKHDNWGHLSYNFDMIDMRHDYRLRSGKNVTIRFKSGKELRTSIASRVIISSVSDHGKSYDVKTEELGIRCNFEGNEIFMDLSEVEVSLSNRLKQGTLVRYQGMLYGLKNPLCKVRGIADSGNEHIDEFIGDSYILECVEPNKDLSAYPYTHFVTTECNFKVVEFNTPKQLKDVHTEHCCLEHRRCKYGEEETCTVCQEIAPPSYPCNCDW